MIFVNSRRLAERLAGALNELAGSEVALAHHGSVARDKRQEMEERLKLGTLPAIVATSSLELGIDMGAVDLVVQIEAPPSIASGMQRIGRASHQVGGVPHGVIFPKHRGDLLCSAAAASGMTAGQVEETFYPRNPLDVLAQQVVALACDGVWKVDEVYSLVRRAAPFAELPRASFDGVLDMLSGRYPSDEFAELRPRLTGTGWRARCARERERRGWRSPTREPSRIEVYTEYSLRRMASSAGWASWTRRWSSSRGWGTSSCWAPPPGASTRSPRTR
jgi:ATP-dependent Lhr-like helicase